MNSTPKEADETDSRFDDDELDVYSISENQLWDRSELEEMRAPKTSTTNTTSTNEAMGGESRTPVTKEVSPVKTKAVTTGAESRPDFYHGVGPYNDVNLPGVWFFRIPHKVLDFVGFSY